MAKLLWRNVRSGKRRSLIEELNDIAIKELEGALEDTKKALVKSHELIVADWNHDVQFQSRKYIRPDQLSVNVFPAGPNKQIWQWVDEGTEPHQIPERRPKKAKAMRFAAGGEYVPRTKAKPARTVSSGGKVVGGTQVYAQVASAYTHPGSEAREFSKTIAEDIEPDFKRHIENAFRRVNRRIQE